MFAALLKRPAFEQFLRFGIVGASSTVIDWGFYFALTRLFGIYYLLAKALSFLVAVCNSYFWNRRWTFRSTHPDQLRQFAKFLTTNLIGLGLNTSIMYLVVSRMGLTDYVGLPVATALVTIWNFTASKFWTFRA